jgi:rhodanese-related sulfurtransferase
MSLLLRTLLLVVVGTGLAVVSNLSREKPMTWVYDPAGTLDDEDVLRAHAATFLEVQALYDIGVPFLIDARKRAVYEKGHVLGALSVPFDTPEEGIGDVFINCIPEELLVVYCEGKTCESSKVVCRFLEENGFTSVKIYLEGYDSLLEQGLEAIDGPGPWGEELDLGDDMIHALDTDASLWPEEAIPLPDDPPPSSDGGPR